jgi:acyl carrier protein
MPGDDLVTAIAAVARRHVAPEAAAELAGPDAASAPLALDSLGIVAFMVELEHDLGVAFPDALIERSTFASVGSVAAALRDLR